MIRALPNAGFVVLFERYLRWLTRRSLRGVYVRGGLQFPRGGFIAAANHTSWWDGFVPFLAQRRLAPETPFALMMDEDQLRRFPFFRLGGAFSIDPTKPRSAYESVRYAAQLARSGFGVWIFPEGRIAPPASLQPFARGYVRAARAAGVPIVPVALRFAMLDGQRPDAFIEIAQPFDASQTSINDRISACIESLLARLDAQIAMGTAREGRMSLVAARPGIDEGVARAIGLVRRA